MIHTLFLTDSQNFNPTESRVDKERRVSNSPIVPAASLHRVK